MNIGEALSYANEGNAIRRNSWNGCFIVFKQIPAIISREKITAMLSIPEDVKKLIVEFSDKIEYQNQLILFNFYDGVATYYVSDGEDLLEDDWEVVDINSYNPFA